MANVKFAKKKVKNTVLVYYIPSFTAVQICKCLLPDIQINQTVLI